MNNFQNLTVFFVFFNFMEHMRVIYRHLRSNVRCREEDVCLGIEDWRFRGHRVRIGWFIEITSQRYEITNGTIISL